MDSCHTSGANNPHRVMLKQSSQGSSLQSFGMLSSFNWAFLSITWQHHPREFQNASHAVEVSGDLSEWSAVDEVRILIILPAATSQKATKDAGRIYRRIPSTAEDAFDAHFALCRDWRCHAQTLSNNVETRDRGYLYVSQPLNCCRDGDGTSDHTSSHRHPSRGTY